MRLHEAGWNKQETINKKKNKRQETKSKNQKTKSNDTYRRDKGIK
jgi:hypothetical protein